MLCDRCRNNIFLEELLSFLLEYFFFFPCIKLFLWFNILLHPLVLFWILSYYVNSSLSSFMHNYVDIYYIIPGFCRYPLGIMIVLTPFFLNLPQKYWAFLCIMVCCVTIHACHRWKWKFPCIVSWLLEFMEHYWTYASSKYSSTLSSTSVSTSISSWYIVLRYLIVLLGVILWLCIIILRLRSVLLLMRSVVWGWYLVKLRCIFPCHHLFLCPICV
jgi:hypothetical protein